MLFCPWTEIQKMYNWIHSNRDTKISYKLYIGFSASTQYQVFQMIKYNTSRALFTSSKCFIPVIYGTSQLLFTVASLSLILKLYRQEYSQSLCEDIGTKDIFIGTFARTATIPSFIQWNSGRTVAASSTLSYHQKISTFCFHVTRGHNKNNIHLRHCA